MEDFVTFSHILSWHEDGQADCEGGGGQLQHGGGGHDWEQQIRKQAALTQKFRFLQWPHIIQPSNPLKIPVMRFSEPYEAPPGSFWSVNPPTQFKFASKNVSLKML